MIRLSRVLVVAFVACAHDSHPPEKGRVSDQSMPTSLPASIKDLSGDLEPIRVKNKLPALGAAVWRGDEVLAIGATGYRKQGGEERVTLDDRWHLGSDTKAMTAVLVAIWIDRGKLHFDDTLGTLFGDDVHLACRAVTVEQVLEHRGGLPHQFPADIWKDMWRAGDDLDGRTTAIKTLLSRAPTQPVGTFQYANTGYVTLGAALERVTHRRWEDLMRTDLFAPLGMTSCGFGAPTGAAPRGHRRDGDALVAESEHADNPPSNAPAGGIHCSLRDWGRFLAVVLAGARGEHVALVSDASMKRLLTSAADAKDNERYAGGWSFTTRPWAGGTTLTHSGSNTLWRATAWIAPAKNMSFVAVSNAPDFGPVDEAFSTTVPVFAK